MRKKIEVHDIKKEEKSSKRKYELKEDNIWVENMIPLLAGNTGRKHHTVSIPFVLSLSSLLVLRWLQW